MSRGPVAARPKDNWRISHPSAPALVRRVVLPHTRALHPAAEVCVMIVPSNRLLLGTAIIVVPCALLGAVEPSATVFSAGAILVFAVSALIDVLRARSAVAKLTVTLPAVVRMSKDRECRFDVQLGNPARRARTIRLALAMPQEIVSAQEAALIALPGDAEQSRFIWACTPHKRGNFRLPSAHVELSSRFGFWAARKAIALSSELRVYPNLARERRSMAALFLKRGLGLHAQRQIGKGRDFEKLREYLPGDSYDEIHWKATARRGKPITKIFQIERTQEVYVILDASRLSARTVETSEGKPTAAQDTEPNPVGPVSSPGASEQEPVATTALERFITAGLLLGLAAEQQGDLFGLLTFSDRVNSFVRAKNGKAHYSACRDTLYTLEPKIVTPDYDELCTFIRLRLRRRALLVFLTSLDDPVIAESFVRNLDLVRRQHLVLVNMIQPPGVVPVFTNPNVGSVDDLYRHLGGHLLWSKLRELEKVLQRRGVRFSLLENERLAAELVSQYLNVKRRQML